MNWYIHVDMEEPPVKRGHGSGYAWLHDRKSIPHCKIDKRSNQTSAFSGSQLFPDTSENI